MQHPTSGSQRFGYRRSAPFAVAVLALTAIACGLSGVTAQQTGAKAPPKGRTARKKPVQVRTLLLFPMDAHGTGADTLAEVVTEAAKSRLAASDQFDVGVYRSSLASIRRALKEGAVSAKGANAPFDSVSKVQNLTRLVGYDLAVDGSIDTSYDEAHHQATISVTLGIVDLANGKTSTRNFADSVTTPENSVKTADDLDTVKTAARELTEKLTDRLLEPPPAPSKDTKTDGKTGSGQR
jgi:hypothetical protein